MIRTAVLSAVVLLPISAIAQGTNAYIQHNLVSDVLGLADVTDPNLVNPWGISYGATGPFWVSNYGKGNSTLYNGSGTITPIVVPVPGASGSQLGKPTGQVNNTNTTAFLIPSVNRPASFIFSTEDGTISAWVNGIAGNVAAIVVNNSSSGAVYKGLAIATSSAGPVLYAPNFRSGNIEVYDSKFATAKLTGNFADPNVPAGFAPFNIWALGGKLYVLYAKQDANKLNDQGGLGNGYVAVFDFDGNLIKHLISGGALNSPWGVAIAPSTFGAFGGALLVGNFGDGKINAYDVNSGALLGTLQDPNGKAIVINGLWALIFGNGASGGDKNTLYFAAGIQGQQHGLLGSISVPSAILSVRNGASQLAGPIAQGEVIVLTGLTIGPSPTASAVLPASGTVGTNLGGVSVYINGISAPILYSGASQTSVVVPYEIGSSSTADIIVTYRDQIAKLQVPTALAAPGIFTLDFSGTGQATALNVEGTINGANRPATAGTVVTLFATGEGATFPPGEDGVINDRILRTPQQKVSLSIAGKDAQVIYAGTAFGSVQGVMQVEALIPGGVSGTVPVLLTIGGGGTPAVSSQPNVTITVR